MLDQATVRLTADLADRTDRPAAARRLAAHLGADAVLVLVEDAAVEAFLPAPGFAPTLPGGPAWREFLQRARHPGSHEGRIGYPAREPLAAAVAHTEHGLMLVFIGECCDSVKIDAVRSVLPLLASTLRAEHEALAAKGELRVAQDHARQAETLARALDGARAEVERTVQELERQARELHKARVRAEEAAGAKDEFLAMLGHELRNPLSPILTALQLMRLKGQSSREQDVIERQVESLTRLVEDLLDVSRITRGKVELRKEAVDFAEIAARAIEMSSPVLEKKRQALTVQIPRGFVVEADPSRLAQVFSNLLTNAGKYSDVDTRILFAAERDGGRIRVRVRDEGVGIGPELLERVFDVFVQHRQSPDRSQGGLGLGLAIVRSLVHLHDGTVRVQSGGEGQGSEFVVELPASDAAAGTAPVAQPLASVAGLGRAGGDLDRVLVVDDNDDAAHLMSEALASLGYAVRTAPDGPTALRVAEEFRPQVALLDIGLPVMDGYELAQRLRQTPGARRLRLVAVTGYGRSDDRLRSRETGFDAHLVKPIALHQLQEVLAGFGGGPGPGR